MASGLSHAASPNLDNSLPSLFLSLLLVIVVILVAASLVKKTNLMSNKTKGLKVVSVLPVSTREKLMVVDVGGQQLLLGVTQQQISLLKELETPIETENKPDFALNLKQFMNPQK